MRRMAEGASRIFLACGSTDFRKQIVSASKEGVVHNRSFFVILTTDSFEALFISYFKPAGIR